MAGTAPPDHARMPGRRLAGLSHHLHRGCGGQRARNTPPTPDRHGMGHLALMLLLLHAL